MTSNSQASAAGQDAGALMTGKETDSSFDQRDAAQNAEEDQGPSILPENGKEAAMPAKTTEYHEAAGAPTPAPDSLPEDGNAAATPENIVSHVPDAVLRPDNQDGSSVVSPLPLPNVTDAPPRQPMVAAVQAALAQPKLPAPVVSHPIVRMAPGANGHQVKKTRGRFNILQSDPIIETSDESGTASDAAVAAAAQSQVPKETQQHDPSSISVVSQMTVSLPEAPGTAPKAIHAAVTQTTASVVSAPPGNTTGLPAAQARAQSLGAASVSSAPLGNTVPAGQVAAGGPSAVVSTASGSTPGPPVGKKKGRFVVMPATAVDNASITTTTTEGLARQSSAGAAAHAPEQSIPQQVQQPQAPVPQMQTVFMPLPTQQIQPGMEHQQMPGSVLNSFQVPMAVHMSQQGIQMAPASHPAVMAYPSGMIQVPQVQFQHVPQQVVVHPGPMPEQTMQYAAQPIYHAQQIPHPQQQLAAGVVHPPQTQPPMPHPGAGDQHSSASHEVSAPPGRHQTAPQIAHGVPAPMQPGQEGSKAPPPTRPVPNARPPAAVARPAAASKATASAHQRGASTSSGLGKAFYFLEQMKLEVTDADRTIKTLQKDMRHLRERNKELEAKSKSMEAKWIEEKNARETTESKLKSLKKKFKELKENVPGASEPVEPVNAHSRTNSHDGDHINTEKNVFPSGGPASGPESPSADSDAEKNPGRGPRSEAHANRSQKNTEPTAGRKRDDKSPPRTHEGLSDAGPSKRASKTISSMNDPNRKRADSNEETVSHVPPTLGPRTLQKSHHSASSLGVTTGGDFAPLRPGSGYTNVQTMEGIGAASPPSAKQTKSVFPIVAYDPLHVNTGAVPVQMMVSVPVMGNSPEPHHARSYSESMVAAHQSNTPGTSQVMLDSNQVAQHMNGMHLSTPHLGYATTMQIPQQMDPFAAHVQPMYTSALNEQIGQTSQLQPPPPPPSQQQQLPVARSSDPFDELALRRAPTQGSPHGTPQGTPNTTPQQQVRNSWTGQ